MDRAIPGGRTREDSIQLTPDICHPGPSASEIVAHPLSATSLCPKAFYCQSLSPSKFFHGYESYSDSFTIRAETKTRPTAKPPEPAADSEALALVSKFHPGLAAIIVQVHTSLLAVT